LNYLFTYIHALFGKLFLFSIIGPMTKLLNVIFSVFAILFIVSFVGCSDKEAEAEICRLEQTNAGLQHTVDSLQHTLDSLNAYGDSVKNSLQKLDMHL